MRVKFGVLEQTQGLHLYVKFHPNVFIMSASGGQKPQYWANLDFSEAPVPIVVCPTASSYLQTANVSAGSVVEMAAIHKTYKYQELAAQYVFQPIALESLGSIDSDTCDFLVDFGRRITRASSDEREISFLF